MNTHNLRDMDHHTRRVPWATRMCGQHFRGKPYGERERTIFTPHRHSLRTSSRIFWKSPSHAAPLKLLTRRRGQLRRESAEFKVHCLLTMVMQQNLRRDPRHGSHPDHCHFSLLRSSTQVASDGRLVSRKDLSPSINKRLSVSYGRNGTICV